jgi:phenylalanyl-tRNA synthetase alpha chain
MSIKSNITPSIREKMNRNIHNTTNHPIEIIKRKIYDYFGDSFVKFDNLAPIVDVSDNFDKLLIPKDHPARGTTDTYYLNENQVLRTHTSAHQNELLTDGYTKFLVTGDVYRKDEIDSCHYPVFHQMEGMCVYNENEDVQSELIKTIDGLVATLFPGCEYRVSEDYFPFTDPSIEVEVKFNGKWLEILGAGIVRQEILSNCNLEGKKAWAFGLGLERLAMILFKIPDIRYFWTSDERFIKQFESGNIVEFKEYSKYPSCYKDVAFWINEEYNYNNFCEIVRECGGDIIEEISLIDNFTNPKNEKTSHCYRINYRSNDRNLTNEEVDEIQNKIRNLIQEEMNLEIR